MPAGVSRLLRKKELSERNRGSHSVTDQKKHTNAITRLGCDKMEGWNGFHLSRPKIIGWTFPESMPPRVYSKVKIWSIHCICYLKVWDRIAVRRPCFQSHLLPVQTIKVTDKANSKRHFRHFIKNSFFFGLLRLGSIRLIARFPPKQTVTAVLEKGASRSQLRLQINRGDAVETNLPS